MACDEQTEMRQCGRLWAHNFFWNSTEKQLDIDLFNSRVMRKKRGKPSCHLVLLLFFWLHPTFSKSSITQFNHTAQFVLSVTLFNLYFCLFRFEFDYISSSCPGCAYNQDRSDCYHPIVIQMTIKIQNPSLPTVECFTNHWQPLVP